MLSEEQKLMLLLKGPEDYAHRAGKEMLLILNGGKRLRYKAMFKVADHHFETIMQVFNTEQSIRIIKTWLSIYQLPFDPDRLKTFDQFYDMYGSVIYGRPELIRSY
jgi:hypothetical protein